MGLGGKVKTPYIFKTIWGFSQCWSRRRGEHLAGPMCHGRGDRPCGALWHFARVKFRGPGQGGWPDPAGRGPRQGRPGSRVAISASPRPGRPRAGTLAPRSAVSVPWAGGRAVWSRRAAPDGGDVPWPGTRNRLPASPAAEGPGCRRVAKVPTKCQKCPKSPPKRLWTRPGFRATMANGPA
jgi:hypothetical protein